MRSWDLFDTLIASRYSHPAGDDLQQLIPIAENIDQVQQDDIIVSDYYNYEDAERALRGVTGLQNKLIVTPTGKRDGTVWNTLNGIVNHMGITEHIGDNEHSDIQTPREYGVKTRHTTVTNRTLTEIKAADFGFPGLAGVMREARLRTSKTETHLEDLQTQVNFPFLYLASLLLHRKLRAEGYRRVLMSSRDACLWFQLLMAIRDAHKDMHTSDYDVLYFYTSRVPRTNPSDSYAAYVNRLLERSPALIVDIGGTGKTLHYLTHNPKIKPCDFWLLVWYNKATQIARDYERSAGWPDNWPPIPPNGITGCNSVEVANLANHDMIVDVVDGLPVYQRDKLDPTTWQPIQTMHKAFYTCLDALRFYDLWEDFHASDAAVMAALKHFAAKFGETWQVGEYFVNDGNREISTLLSLLKAEGEKL